MANKKNIKKSHALQWKSERKERLKKARKAKDQIRIVSRVFNNLEGTDNHMEAIACLNSIAEILSIRRKAHDIGQMYAGANHAMACHHLTRIGSSQFYRLKQNKFGLEAIHRREFYSGARNEGRKWEQEWAQSKNFICGQRYKILRQIYEPFRESVALPWMCATPDFIAEVQAQDKSQFWAAIEVKSVEKRIERAKFESQLRISMDCFGLNTGFLVIYITSFPSQHPTIIRLDQNNYLNTHRDKFQDDYFQLVSRCLGELFSTEISAVTVKEALSPVLPITIQPVFCTEWLTGSRPNTKLCYYNGLRRGYALKKQLPKFYKNMPSLLIDHGPDHYKYVNRGASKDESDEDTQD